MEQCRAVFFDFDGTLVDSNAIKREAFFEVTSGFFGDQEYLTHLLDSNTELTRYQIFKKFPTH